MKKLLVAVMAAALFVSPLFSTAQALEPLRTQSKNITENGRRPPPPPRRGGWDYDRGRHHDNGSSAGAIVAGSLLLGAAIVGAATRPKVVETPVYIETPVYVQPAPVYVEPAPVYVQPAPTTVYTPRSPVLVCDQYNNCWYQ